MLLCAMKSGLPTLPVPRVIGLLLSELCEFAPWPMSTDEPTGVKHRFSLDKSGTAPSAPLEGQHRLEYNIVKPWRLYGKTM